MSLSAAGGHVHTPLPVTPALAALLGPATASIEGDKFFISPLYRKIQLDWFIHVALVAARNSTPTADGAEVNTLAATAGVVGGGGGGGGTGHHQENVDYMTQLEELIYIQACIDRHPFIHYRTEMQRILHHIPAIVQGRLSQQYTAAQLLKLDDAHLVAITGRARHGQAMMEQRKQSQDLLRHAARLKLGEGWLQCRKCGSTEIKFQQKQVRSADEGSTIFCICQNIQCGQQFRID